MLLLLTSQSILFIINLMNQQFPSEILFSFQQNWSRKSTLNFSTLNENRSFLFLQTFSCSSSEPKSLVHKWFFFHLEKFLMSFLWESQGWTNPFLENISTHIELIFSKTRFLVYRWFDLWANTLFIQLCLQDKHSADITSYLMSLSCQLILQSSS